MLDSTAWFHYLARTPAGYEVRRRLRRGPATAVRTPSIVLAEVVGKLRLRGRNPRPFLDALARHSAVEPLSHAVAELGGELYGALKARRPRVSLVDALVLAHARVLRAECWTSDADLEGEPGVRGLPRGA